MLCETGKSLFHTSENIFNWLGMGAAMAHWLQRTEAWSKFSLEHTKKGFTFNIVAARDISDMFRSMVHEVRPEFYNLWK